MAFVHTMDVPAPIEMYDESSAEVEQRTGRPLPEGCLVHIVSATDAGFRVTEVWESTQAYESFEREVLSPVIQQVAQAHGMTPEPPQRQTADVHRLRVSDRASAAV